MDGVNSHAQVFLQWSRWLVVRWQGHHAT